MLGSRINVHKECLRRVTYAFYHKITLVRLLFTMPLRDSSADTTTARDRWDPICGGYLTTFSTGQQRTIAVRSEPDRVLNDWSCRANQNLLEALSNRGQLLNKRASQQSWTIRPASHILHLRGWVLRGSGERKHSCCWSKLPFSDFEDPDG